MALDKLFNNAPIERIIRVQHSHRAHALAAGIAGGVVGREEAIAHRFLAFGVRRRQAAPDAVPLKNRAIGTGLRPLGEHVRFDLHARLLQPGQQPLQPRGNPAHIVGSVIGGKGDFHSGLNWDSRLPSISPAAGPTAPGIVRWKGFRHIFSGWPPRPRSFPPVSSGWSTGPPSEDWRWPPESR
jgi:hypothetical protein